MYKNTAYPILKYRLPIMGLAALWIFIFHESEHEWVKVYFSPQWLSSALYFIKRIGFCGVDIFLLLSGIGLVHSIEKHSLTSFYSRRLKRVFLPFFVVGLIRMFVDGWSLSTFLRKIFLYDFLFVNINSLLWFIPVILILYLFFPLYYKYFSNSRRKILFTLAAFTVWLVFSLLMKDTLRGDLYAFTNRIPIFLTGVLCGWYMREEKLNFRRPWLFLFVGIFFVGLILSFLTNYRSLYLLVPISNCCVPTFLLATSCTVLAAEAFSLIDRFYLGKGILKILSFFGKMSLEIYIVQEWLDDILRPRLIPSYESWINNFAFINLAIAVCVFTAAFILYYFTKPRNFSIISKLSKTAD